MIAQQADPSANIIWGAAFDESMDDAISVTVIATGFSKRESEFPVHPSSRSSAGYSDNLRNFNASKKESDNSDDDSFYDIMSIFKNR